MDADRVTRITRKVEIIWLHTPNLSLVQLLQGISGDWNHTKPTDEQIEARLDEILQTVKE